MPNNSLAALIALKVSSYLKSSHNDFALVKMFFLVGEIRSCLQCKLEQNLSTITLDMNYS